MAPKPKGILACTEIPQRCGLEGCEQRPEHVVSVPDPSGRQWVDVAWACDEHRTDLAAEVLRRSGREIPEGESAGVKVFEVSRACRAPGDDGSPMCGAAADYLVVGRVRQARLDRLHPPHGGVAPRFSL